MARVLILLLAAAAAAAKPAESTLENYDPQLERATLIEVLTLARSGALGFAWPEGFQFSYEPKYGACGRLGANNCVAITDDEPFEPSPSRRPAWAVTDPSRMHTIFFRHSATAQDLGVVEFVNPETGLGQPEEINSRRPPPAGFLSVSIQKLSAFSAREMAAYVIGHEVRGHIVERLDGTSSGEQTCNYYGLEAVRALREHDRSTVVAER